jgi:hypothetical protein
MPSESRQGHGEGRNGEVTPIAGNLWQGGPPPEGTALAEQGFDMLVLCAEEHQPSSSQFPGLTVVRAPNDDRPKGPPPTADEVLIAHLAAKTVAKSLFKGRKVLVTCMQGRNRSGLVSGLAMVMLGESAAPVIQRIRERRENALTNPYFVEIIKGYKP